MTGGGLPSALAGLVLAGALAALAIAEPAASVTGHAYAVDGDTVRVGGSPVRLFGVDAPESRQRCLDASARSWACGEAATAALRGMLARDPQVTCVVRDTDGDGRTVAVCANREGDLGARRGALGMAVIVEKYGGIIYKDEQDAAKQEKIGVWQGDFQMPYLWRKTHAGSARH